MDTWRQEFKYMKPKYINLNIQQETRKWFYMSNEEKKQKQMKTKSHPLKSQTVIKSWKTKILNNKFQYRYIECSKHL